jgi:hypothetical protein
MTPDPALAGKTGVVEMPGAARKEDGLGGDDACLPLKTGGQPRRSRHASSSTKTARSPYRSCAASTER